MSYTNTYAGVDGVTLRAADANDQFDAIESAFTTRNTIPGPIGSTTPSTGAFTTLSASSTVSGAGFTARFSTPGPIGDSTPSTGAFTTLSASGAVSGAGFTAYFASPPAIGGTAAAAGSFTTLLASGNTGFGVTSPAYPVEVLSNTGFIGINIRADSGSGLAGISFSNNAGNTVFGRIYSVSPGYISFSTGSTGSTQAQIVDVATAVNSLTLSGAVTGSSPIIGVLGADSNVGLRFATKGTGSIDLMTASTAVQAKVLDTPSASRYLTFTGSNGGNPTISTSAGNLAITPAVVCASTVACTAGTGTGQPVMIGALSVNTTAVGNVGAGTDDLMTYSLPANSLSANGKGVRVTGWFETANNVNNKTVIFNFGTKTVTVSLNNSVQSYCKVVAEVIRTGSNAQRLCFALINNSAGTTQNQYNYLDTCTETDTSAITIKFTGIGTADNDIVQKFMLVEFIS